MTRCTSLLLACLAFACEGSIADVQPPNPIEDGPDLVDVPTPDECLSALPSADSQPMRRLTLGQYENVFVDGLELGALPAPVAQRLPSISEGRTGGFNSSDTPATEEDLRGYIDMATDLARALIADPSSHVGCELAADATCFAQLFDAIAPRLLRRPAHPEEREAYVGIYDEFVGSDGNLVAAETALTALFASPSVLYHAEPTTVVEGDAARLEAYALANRLSFFLWNSAPDDELLAAAGAGQLDERAGLETQVERMLEDPRSRRQTESFYAQFLMLERVDEIAPEGEVWERLGDRLMNEAYDLAHYITNNEGTFNALLTADYTIGDADLAAHYGAAPPDSSGRIALNPEERSGVLTLASVMAILHRDRPEIFRGELIRANFLCDAQGDPPPIGDEERAIDRLVTQPCAGCHMTMDPIGFGFGAFDSMGRYVADEAQGGEIVDAQGHFADPSTAGAFDSPRELGGQLAGSADAQNCFADQWFRYSLGRRDGAADACSVYSVRDEFIERGGDIHALFTAIALSTSFRSRAASDLNEGEER